MFKIISYDSLHALWIQYMDSSGDTKTLRIYVVHDDQLVNVTFILTYVYIPSSLHTFVPSILRRYDGISGALNLITNS